MISKDPRHGLLETRTKREVMDIPEPNLLREMFPYAEVPRIVFDGKSVPMEPAKEFFITDTTFRDGQQARPPYTVEQIVAHLRHAQQARRSERRHPRVASSSSTARRTRKPCGSAWSWATDTRRSPAGSARPRTTSSSSRSMGLKETGILTSASDYHIFLKFKKTRAQMLDHYLDLVTTALESGLDAVRCHLEDITRADFDGFIIPFVAEADGAGAGSRARSSRSGCATRWATACRTPRPRCREAFRR